MPDADALDRTLRDGLDATVRPVPSLSTEGLATRLAATRTRRRRRRAVQRAAIVSVAAIVLVAAIVAWPRPEPSTYVETGPDRSVPAGLLGQFLARVAPLEIEGLEPGWHQIDSSPIPDAGPVTLAWTGDQLLVSLPFELYGFHPPSGTWTELDLPPIEHPAYQLVEHDGAVYAIEADADGGASARLDLTTGQWERLGDTAPAAALEAGGMWGPQVPGGLVGAVSTGDRLFDLRHGAVVDPGSSQWRSLPFPDDLDPRMLNGTAVWTGDEVVLLTSTDGGGLAWNADGTSVRRIPGPLSGATDSLRSPQPGATALAIESGVVVLDPDGRAALMDPRTGEAIESFPPSPLAESDCAAQLVLAGGTPLLTSCDGSSVLDLTTAQWVPTATAPLPKQANTLGTSEAAFAWSPVSVTPESSPPYNGGAVWIPPRGEEAPAQTPGPTTPITTGGVDLGTLGPGWHRIESPVPATEGVGSWTGDRLVVGGRTGIYVFTPGTGEWAQHEPPFGGSSEFTFAAQDDMVVAVAPLGLNGTGPKASAALDLDTGQWTSLSSVGIASQLEAVGATLPGGQASLLWAGDHLFDMSYGAVLDGGDLDAGWRPIPFPENLVPYTGLLYTNPVWDGEEVVLVSWSTEGGLAWNSEGTRYRELPGMPASIHRRPGFNGDTAAVRSGDDLVVVTDGGLAAALDPSNGLWRALPSVPDMPSSEGCPDHIATARGVVIVSTCNGEDVVVEDGETWKTAGPPPEVTRVPNRWLGTQDAVLVWAASTDTSNYPGTPVSALYAFVPPT